MSVIFRSIINDEARRFVHMAALKGHCEQGPYQLLAIAVRTTGSCCGYTSRPSDAAKAICQGFNACV
jgi:hypothetical protein